jgi:hypothetical protein
MGKTGARIVRIMGRKENIWIKEKIFILII